jgi:hypothetical protein
MLISGQYTNSSIFDLILADVDLLFLFLITNFQKSADQNTFGQLKILLLNDHFRRFTVYLNQINTLINSFNERSLLNRF